MVQSVGMETENLMQDRLKLQPPFAEGSQFERLMPRRQVFQAKKDKK
jgi:hypothetical protein